MKLQDRATNLTDIITPRELVLHLKKRSQENKSHDQARITRLKSSDAFWSKLLPDI